MSLILDLVIRRDEHEALFVWLDENCPDWSFANLRYDCYRSYERVQLCFRRSLIAVDAAQRRMGYGHLKSGAKIAFRDPHSAVLTKLRWDTRDPPARKTKILVD